MGALVWKCPALGPGARSMQARSCGPCSGNVPTNPIPPARCEPRRTKPRRPGPEGSLPPPGGLPLPSVHGGSLASQISASCNRTKARPPNQGRTELKRAQKFCPALRGGLGGARCDAHRPTLRFQGPGLWGNLPSPVGPISAGGESLLQERDPDAHWGLGKGDSPLPSSGAGKRGHANLPGPAAWIHPHRSNPQGPHRLGQRRERKPALDPRGFH